MKLKILSTCIAILLINAIGGNSLPGQIDSEETGISASQLRQLADSLPPSSGAVETIQFLRSGQINRAAILTSGHRGGWQIFVFHLEDNGKFALEWKSGKLDDSFAGSSADQFQPYNSFDEQTFKFSGCAAHNCPDVFSVMLYIPSKSMAITATYILGKVTYSPSAISDSGYQIYRTYLDKLIAERRSVTN